MTNCMIERRDSPPMDRFKEFRDNIGAHSDYSANIPSLPSHAEIETFFNSAKDFYEIVSRSLIQSNSTDMPKRSAMDSLH